MGSHRALVERIVSDLSVDKDEAEDEFSDMNETLIEINRKRKELINKFKKYAADNRLFELSIEVKRKRGADGTKSDSEVSASGITMWEEYEHKRNRDKLKFQM